MSDDNQRIVLLNTMLSLTKTKAKNHKAPTMGGLELFKILEGRRTKKLTVEYFGVREDSRHDDDTRIKTGLGHDCVRLRQLRFEEAGQFTYVTALIEFVDVSVKSFPVVHVETFAGREIAGDRQERGAATAHVVIRIPYGGLYDDGKYRCAIEAVHSVTRHDIETLFCRQLRRYAKSVDLSFSVQIQRKRKIMTKQYQFTPQLHLVSDVGRKLNAATEERTLTQMIFTKRSEKQSIGKGTDVDHQEILADIEIKVSANQGPVDKDERNSWAVGVRNYFRHLGYDERLYFRHVNGGIVGGDVHKAIAGAADLLMCQREHIALTKPPKDWHRTIDDEIATSMRGLVDRDALWEHIK